MENRTDNIIFSFIGFFLGALSVVCWLSIGNWLLGVLGMDLAKAQVLLSILKYASVCLCMGIALLSFARCAFREWRKKRKREKQENAAMKERGGGSHE